MKLKRLDIHGFKSFYHRTTLVFDDGITAVVGPNGCGKSNIVDAIKWVMGEQGAKALRGGAMEDVIFAGSERRGSMGMGEVRLTFTNDGSAEVPARWQGVPELAIERRIERSKGSDYLLNKRRCRLADVQELVAGTGVGSGPGGQRAYAIIEQGQIGRIVSAKADERRLLIEEAAGITRYRTRRRQAERKMQETRDNIERLQDVLGEVESRMRSLKRQARKAERYAEYRDEAREIALRQIVCAWLEVAAAHRQVEAQLAAHTSALDDQERAFAIAVAQRTAASASVRLTEDIARRATDALTAAEQAAQAARGELTLLAQQISAAEERVASALADQAEATARDGDLETELRAATARKDALEAAVPHRDDVKAQSQAQAQAQATLKTARAALEDLRRAEAEQARTLARASAERDAARRQRDDLRQRAAAAGVTAESATQEAVTASTRCDAARARVEAAQESIEAAAVARTDAETAGQAARTASQTAAADERRHMQALADTRGRHKALADLERRHAGIGAGSKAALDAKLPGVRGVVASELDVPAEWETAVGAALADALTGVLVDDADAAKAVLKWLIEKKKGRATLVRADAAPVALGRAPDDAGVIGRLVDQLDAPSPVAVALLGDVLLVDDVSTALRVDWSGPIVTRGGARIDGDRLLRGGSQTADTSTLSRRREQKALAEKIAQIDTARAEAEAQRVAHESARSAARRRVDDARKAVHAAELARADARKDLARAESEVARARRAAQTAEADATRLNAEANAAQQRAEAAAQTVASADVANTDRQTALTAAEAQVEDAEARRDRTVAALHAAKAERAARAARIDEARNALNRLTRERVALNASTQRAEKIRLTADTERRLFEERRTDMRRRLATAQAEAAERASGVRAERDAAEAARATHSGHEARVDEARATRDVTRDALTEARMAAQSHALRAQHLSEQVQERYRRSLGDVVTDYHHRPLPTAEDAERLRQLEALIERMGPVNLNAIEECAEVEERHAFLDGQRADLEAALDDLQAAIGRIDTTSRRLFQETFEAVNGHFQRLFPRLFRGGEAHLALTDPDDMLGTGIEMRVQPPGKNVQSVSLLSGGEKAMCAIALVFAVFHVKPSPFCVLDEVDAPLDDANIGRFNAVVREMAQMSQILLITHNKRTMEIADVLYGVTMEESGVSKLVGVRMDR
ncbi:MAG: chromosome segregation protein [Bradymonadia bacterium]|jgi:chromosome segregation protein